MDSKERKPWIERILGFFEGLDALEYLVYASIALAVIGVGILYLARKLYLAQAWGALGLFLAFFIVLLCAVFRDLRRRQVSVVSAVALLVWFAVTLWVGWG